jgi:hypothetical protein
MNKLSFYLFVLIVMTASFCVVQITEAEEIIHSEYFSTEQSTLPDGNILEKSVISGPPTPPPGIVRSTASLPESNIAASLNTITGVPAFSWSFGCSPTAASMIGGYYDRNGYPDVYTGPTNAGVMPLNNDLYWSTWVDSGGEINHRCPLSATQNGLDGRTKRGHVDDYWIEYENAGPDPFITNSWTEHTHGESFGDYMGTSQSSSPMNNIDGGTTFWNDVNGQKVTTADLFAFGPEYYNSSGLYGIHEFYWSRGYTVLEAYNQYIYPYGSNTEGFTYEQYKAEIDSGRPVLLHVTGHSMVGVGYNDSSSNLMYIHDTWDHSVHTMTWGGSYSGMSQYAVSIVILEESDTFEVYGTVSGKVQEGVSISFYRASCGGNTLLDTVTTDSNGDFSFTDVETGLYIVTPEKTGYTFFPESRVVNLRNNSVSGPYDFTAVRRFVNIGH